MILRSRHHFIMYPFFRRYTLWIIRRNFRQVKLRGVFHDRNQPILLLSNHISWWDGFWAEYLNIKVFRRRFYFMMLEEQLRKYWFFNYTGGFSIKKHSRTALESLRYASSLLNDRHNIVLIFPQGKIQSLYNQNIVFQQGIMKIIEYAQNQNIHIVFQAGMIDFFSHSKPSLYIYYDEYKKNDFTLDQLQADYNNFFQKCIHDQISTEP